MQSGVMEERDTAKGIENKGEEQLEPAPESLWSISCEGTKAKTHAHTDTQQQVVITDEIISR